MLRLLLIPALALAVSLTTSANCFAQFDLIGGFIPLGPTPIGSETEFNSAATDAGLTLTTLSFDTDPGNSFTISNDNGSIDFTVDSGNGLSIDTEGAAALSGNVTGNVVGIALSGSFSLPADSDLNASVFSNTNLGIASGGASAPDEIFFGFVADEGESITTIESLAFVLAPSFIVFGETPDLTGVTGNINSITIATAAPTAATVPEPSAVTLLLFGGVASVLRRRRKTS